MIDMLIYSGWAPHVVLVLYSVVGGLIVSSPLHRRVRREVCNRDEIDPDGAFMRIVAAITWPVCVYAMLASMFCRAMPGDREPSGTLTMAVLVSNLVGLLVVIALVLT